jgi:hypothetical protein
MTDPDWVRDNLFSAAAEIDRLKERVAELEVLVNEWREIAKSKPLRTALNCQHPRGKMILTEVGLARHCDDCGYQDFTV